MKVKEWIKILKTFPQEADLLLTESDMCYNGDFILGLSSESEMDYETGFGYNVVDICCLPSYHQDYDDLINEEYELFGDKVWYNTEDFIETFDHEGKKVNLKFDKETKKFYDWTKKMEEMFIK